MFRFGAPTSLIEGDTLWSGLFSPSEDSIFSISDNEASIISWCVCGTGCRAGGWAGRVGVGEGAAVKGNAATAAVSAAGAAIVVACTDVGGRRVCVGGGKRRAALVGNLGGGA